MANFIRRVDNGIEFFTNTTTGQSGISVSGLALLCGVSQPAITKLLQNLITKSPSKWLEPLVGKDLNLITEGVSKSGGEVKVISADACAKVIQHYAFNGNETAQYSLDKFAATGITTWIQEVTQSISEPADLPELPNSKALRRDLAKPLILQSLQQFSQHNNLTITSARELYPHYYAARIHNLPEWVYVAIPSVSRSSLCRWAINPSDNRGRHGRGKSIIACNPQANALLTQALDSQPSLSSSQAFALLESTLPGLCSLGSVKRFMYARRARQVAQLFKALTATPQDLKTLQPSSIQNAQNI